VSAQALAAGIGSLFTAGGFAWVSTAGDPGGTSTRAYDGEAPLTALLPFAAVQQSIPRVESRSEARTRLAHHCIVRVTVTGKVPQQVRQEAQKVIDALDGKRTPAIGWLVSPIELFNTRPLEVDRDVSTHPVFTVLEFEYTATRQEA
jgi:hypothetical protein